MLFCNDRLNWNGAIGIGLCRSSCRKSTLVLGIQQMPVVCIPVCKNTLFSELWEMEIFKKGKNILLIFIINKNNTVKHKVMYKAAF